MARYSVLEVTPTGEDRILGYLQSASAPVARHVGKYPARTAASHQRLEGEGDDDALRTIIDWPSEEAAKAFMGDTAYLRHLEARTTGCVSHHFLVAGKGDLARARLHRSAL